MKRILMFLSLCTIVIGTSCNSNKGEKEAETKLSVTNPLRLDTSMTKEYVCQIRAIRHIEIRAQERGYLQNIYVDEGQFVKEGQLLFRVMPKIYEAEMHKSEAEAKVAEIEYQNTKKLADSNVVSQNELAMSKARYEKAKAELALSQVHLQFTELRAPFDGILDRFQVKLGSLIEEGDLLTTLSDNSKMWVYFNVTESEYLNYKSRMNDSSMLRVRLRMANNQIFPYEGDVQTIEADFNNETGNIPFRATFPNPKGLLRHGETGNVIVEVPLPHALVIPQKATFEVLEKRFVFVVDKNNVVHQRAIEIGADMQDLFVISAGLNENEKILLEGLRKVKDGDKIEFNYEEPRKVIDNLKLFTE